MPKKSKKLDQTNKVVAKSDVVESPYCRTISETLEDYAHVIQKIEAINKKIISIHPFCILDTEEIAKLLSLEPTWFNERRKEGKPPFYYKFGEGKTAPIRYALLEVMDYFLCCRRYSTSDNGKDAIERGEAAYLAKYGRDNFMSIYQS